MFAIFLHEVRLFLNSLIAYLVMAVFLVFNGLYFWVFKESNVLDYGFASMDGLFQFAPMTFLFLIPAITMRSFAEEKRDGTMELLLTKPLGDWDIILGKFFAGAALVLVALLPTTVYYFSLVQLGNPVGNIDTSAVISSYLGLALLGCVFVALGIMASSFTRKQIVAFVLAVVFCYTLFDGIGRLASLDVFSTYKSSIVRLGLDFHYAALSKGLIDSRPLVYFLSVTFLALFATRLSLRTRFW